MANEPLDRALGKLEGTVSSMAKQWELQEANATQGRKALYERFETMISKMGEVVHKIDGVTQDVAEMKNEIDKNVMPTIEAYKAEIAKRVGAMAAGKIFWILITALTTAIGFAIHEILTYFGDGKHG